jgi:ubiquinone/menaquinone biosynthesis C-methylase UbiE
LEEHNRTVDKKNKIINDYNSSAQFYDKRYRAIQEEKYKIVLNRYNLNGKTILDLGCGTGLLFEYLCKLGSDQAMLRYNYVAVDISWNMLLKLKSKTLNVKNKKISLLLSDVENLPFRDNVFNSIFSITTFQNLPCIEEGIRELIRVSARVGNLKFSILKKNILLKTIKGLLKSFVKDLEIVDNEDIEDIIIQGKITKN